MKVVIETDSDSEGLWQVTVGDRYSDKLSPDEALWMVVEAFHGKQGRYLRTKEEWARSGEFSAKMRAERDSKS